jgi:hypothetical protein
MMGTDCKRRAEVCRCIRISLGALVLALSFGATAVCADDISGDAPDQYTDDAPDEDADAAPEESAGDGDEDVDEDSGPGFARKAWDVTLLRPLNFIRLAAGCVLMVPVSIISLPVGIDNFQYMADHFVEQPYWDTFARPLGKF